MGTKFSDKAVGYCKQLRGKNYEGCNSDFEFCSVCKRPAKTLEDLEQIRVDINKLAEVRV